ncbi:MAG TPA: asparaginase [Alphaproteobacteria bacterium]|nr:asparaginase [Alphaproteobacteria bacterium]
MQDRIAEGSALLVHVTRGQVVESVHRGIAAIVAADGSLVAGWGDVDRPILPRSANKAIQALPLVESGAADAFGLEDADIALACASHSGEAQHTERVTAWLGRMDLPQGALECGSHLPMHEPTAHAMIRAGEAPCPIHNNCSGKHCGLLSHARLLGDALPGYVDYNHPVQQRLRRAHEVVARVDLSGAPWGIDGCSIPTVAMPLRALAFAMAQFADPSRLPSATAEAAARIARAWRAHPEMVGGTNRFETVVMRHVGGRALLKPGAEAVHVAVLPGRGLGVALKIDDGNSRASEVAMAAILRRLEVLDEMGWRAIGSWTEAPLVNRNGIVTGHVKAAPELIP